MYLRSITLKGFKSFPERSKLDFASGVSVVVGPNGSGKSNITDAVLWALGAQSPTAVRGQSMQDVIFAGSAEHPGRGFAEVEIVLDNSDNTFAAEFSELSILRRLERSGESEYRLNGARCRLVDVAEVLSDTGLGREMHSVVSQGQVEQIVSSRPSERRAILEEAAGLGKHRKRRHRAELKLRRTAENLARAIDVESEARSRLKPLKRQAEAAEQSQRLEGEALELRLELATDDLAAARMQLAACEQSADAARAQRDDARLELEQVQADRQSAEDNVTARSQARDKLTTALFATRSAVERIAMRAERARETQQAASDGRARRLDEIAALEQATQVADSGSESATRLTALEQELAELDARKAERMAHKLSELEAEHERAAQTAQQLNSSCDGARAALDDAERECDQARARRRSAEQGAESARRQAASVGAELAAVNQYLRTADAAPAGHAALSDLLEVTPGYELAVAAALGSLFRSAVCDTLASAHRLLDQATGQGGSACVTDHGSAHRDVGPSTPPGRPLCDFVQAGGDAEAVVKRLLAAVWVVDSADELPPRFEGTVVTTSGRLIDCTMGVVHQAVPGGADELFSQRNRRAELVERSQSCAEAERRATQSVNEHSNLVSKRDSEREQAERTLRDKQRELAQAREACEQLEGQIAQLRAGTGDDPEAVRRAQVEAELGAERRLLAHQEHERKQQLTRLEQLRARVAFDDDLASQAQRAAGALETARGTVELRRSRLQAQLDAYDAAGSEHTEALRRLAKRESELQSNLSSASESVTEAEVKAQSARDALAESQAELERVAQRLERQAGEGPSTSERLTAERREQLEAKVERLDRRREKLGPFNPLAKDEYADALAHVEDLESQRSDLEAAIAELRRVIRDADTEIQSAFDDTFAAASENFSEVVGHLFPGGSGRLRLVAQPQEASDTEEGSTEGAEDSSPQPGVEVEVNPAGKQTKRLSLLSGGEKSLVALAFLFAVFSARPSPFYILDEVEAALDDVNIDRFLQLLGAYSERAQFIVVTHQKRTMAAADRLYGVSMSQDGVSKVISRKLSQAQIGQDLDDGVAVGAAS